MGMDMNTTTKGDSMSLFGADLFGDEIKQDGSGLLCKNFIVPPFSTLDSKQGYWQDRKRAWKSLGIKSEVGRDAGMTYNTHSMEEGGFDEADNTSIFDPVLCEIAYKWFCPLGGNIVDPFAGGSVRGVVASFLGYNYWGCDLRDEQIQANIVQGEKIASKNTAQWVCGDAMEVLSEAPDADFIFSCPPYGDLERYSDDPKDLSTMDYHAFIGAYKRIILRAYNKLKNDRFACFVVGDFRAKDGNYRNFPADTIGAFKAVGFHLYNEGILLTSIATASLRASGQFNASRKLCKTHQNVLVFVKGNAKKATAAINNNTYEN